METDQRVNVLVVDDVPANLLTVEALLGDMPEINLVKAQSGSEALRHMLDKEFALVLLDVAMPEIDGFETARLIRMRENSRYTPIVYLTATGMAEEHMFRGYAVGAVDYLFKPIPPDILRAKVSVFVDLYKKTRTLEQSQAALRALAETLEQRVAERTLRLEEAEAKYRSIFENAIDGIYQNTPDGRLITVNPALANMLGYDSSQELIFTITDIYGQLFVDHESGVLLRHVLETQDFVERFECVLCRKDQNTIWVSWNARAVRDVTGKLLYHEGSIADITDRKQAEEELRLTQAKVIEQERLHALGQMASGIAHDFNNALSPILGYTELLLTRPADLTNVEKVKHHLEIMNTAARDAANIVSRLREFYRHREGDELHLPVNANQVVEQAVSLTQPRWRQQSLASGKEINIVCDLQKVPMVPGCESELREVLTNLIFNATDAMPEGGTITILTRVENGQVDITISDTGTGMTGEVRRRCLEPFFSTKGEQGTGLGLAMVMGIIRRHDGMIEIESEPGFGTTFIIHLPIWVAETNAAGEEVEETVPRSLRVLLVEDELQVQQTIGEYLTSDGHTVETADNGREALMKFYTGRYDIIVTDRAMPELSGDQLAGAIKKRAPNKPVVLLTGFGDLMKSSGDLPDGVDAIVSKPPTIKTIRAAVAKVMKEPVPA